MYLLFWAFALTQPPFLPPAPTPEIKTYLKELGDDDWRTRENATKALIALEYKALGGVLQTRRTTESPEVAQRIDTILARFYGLYCQKKDLPEMPSIWLLDEKTRFPRGVKIEKDTDDDTNFPNYRGIGPAGWCKTMEGYDLAASYYESARKKYNDQLQPEALRDGYKIADDNWTDEKIQRLAMKMYINDLLYYGGDRKKIQKMLDDAAERSVTHRNMHRHYGGGSNGSAIPGPAVDKDEVPDNSEYRFQGWGLAPCKFGRPGLALRFCMVP